MDSKKLGLDIQLNLYKFFFDSEYMHYGYWTPELEVKGVNLKQAQENYTRFVLLNIPDEVKSIVDIGCGSGKVAEELIAMGYRVTCVSPPSNLTNHASERLDGRAKVHSMVFEDFNCTEKYDMAFFSESYQYIDIEKSFVRCNHLLNPGGYILLADFFHTVDADNGPLAGGHRLHKFYNILRNQPYEIVKDIDITDKVAPTLTLINNLTMEVIYPAVMMAGGFLQKKYPWMYRFLCWKFRKKIEKNRNKHFTGQRNPENFKKYKSYRLVLLRKKEEPIVV